MNKMKRKTIEGWVDKAWNQSRAAEEHLRLARYSEAVQAAQECVELSVKSVLSLLDIEYPRSHEWAPEGKAFAAIARRIRERQLLDRLAKQYLDQTIPLPRLLFLMNFWGQFYITAKYGFEVEHLASARDLIKQEEAKLAVQHADECYRAASRLRYLEEEHLAVLASQEAL